ncbi:MAG: Ig-like domain-containing protein, partial [Candidatus Heimdallarchaeota archaeon]
MNKKAIIIIVVYLSMIAFFSEDVSSSYPEIRHVILEQDAQNNIQIIEVTSKVSGEEPINKVYQTNDLISPSYTSLSTSVGNPILDGTLVTLNSLTISSGVGVSSGSVDFLDAELVIVENDTTTNSIYSNRFATKINLPQTVTIQGFAIDVLPTIREDMNFYIGTDLNGTNLRSGLISGYIGNDAFTSGELLYVPFSYCGGVADLTLTALTDYYFILEPTVSSSSSFFQLTQSANNPDNLEIFSWSGSAFSEVITDTPFYLMSSVSVLVDNELVDSNGEASTNWNANTPGSHALLSWYEGSIFYSESFGTSIKTVIASDELFTVTTSSIDTNYLDEVTLEAYVFDDGTPVVGQAVTFYSSDDLVSWTPLATGSTNALGLVSITATQSLAVGNYTLRAKVNDLSYSDSYIQVDPEILIWENIDFQGIFRNNPGAPTFTKINTTIRVVDEEGDFVPNLDFELWYLFDDEYERIPHYYTTNATGYMTADHSLENLYPGNYLNSHYFCPADYIENYQGDSAFGNTNVEKGILDVQLSDYFISWNDDVVFDILVTTLDEGWQNILVELSYYADNQWNVLSQDGTNSSGFASFIWNEVPLTYGSYQLKARTTNDALFSSQEVFSTLHVDRKALSIYIMKDGLPMGNGEEIDLEFSSTMNLEFYAEFEDGSPATNMIIEIKGMMVDEFFFRTLGFITTNGTGYATFNNFENLTLVGYEYGCIAEIGQTGKYEEALLYFKINLIKCTPIIILEDQIGELGAYFDLIAYIVNSEDIPLKGVLVEFMINGLTFQGISDQNGIIRISVAPEISVGEYILFCSIIEDGNINYAENTSILTLTKGQPTFLVYSTYAIVDGYLTISISAFDLLGRPLSSLSVRVSFYGWSDILITDEDGLIEHSFQLSGYDVGYYLIIATFDGNADWTEATASGNLLIYEEHSTLSFEFSNYYCVYGQTILLRAHLETEFGSPLIGRLVQFSIILSDGTKIFLGENSTDINGNVQVLATIAVLPYLYYLEAHYAGNTDFGPSTTTAILEITQGAVIILGSDFDAIRDSTSSFRIRMLSYFGQSIGNVQLSLYIWTGSSWELVNIFTTSELGIVDCIIAVPHDLGYYTLKIEFEGNDIFEEYSLELTMRVINPPPKVVPDLILGNPDVLIVAEGQEIGYNISAPNAVPGAAITVFVFVNEVFNGTFLIIDGYGIYSWCGTSLGTYNLTFVVYEDSIYTVATFTIIVTVIINEPPDLVSYSITDYICDGESFTFEAIVEDMSGVALVYFVANGTLYLLEFQDGVYSTTIYMLRQGVYNTSLIAEDLQGNIAIFDLPQAFVLEKKTQVVQYYMNSQIIEKGEEFTIELLVFAENALSEVYLILNSTEYLMAFSYQIDAHRSVWYLELNTLNVGNYEVKIKMIEITDEIHNNTLDMIKVIPATPLLVQNDWSVEKAGDLDYISGFLTIDSYYDIFLIEIWIDGELIT